MEIATTPIDGVLLLIPARHQDERGFLSEVFNSRALADLGLESSFAQENHLFSTRPATIRGLHYQNPPHSAAKLVRVVTGSIFDVAVDLRKGSPTFGKHFAHTLSEENWTQMYLPVGIAHGLCTLEPDTRVSYFSSAPWSADSDAGIRWNDPTIAIDWPVTGLEPVLSEKDRAQPLLGDIETPFSYEDN